MTGLMLIAVMVTATATEKGEIRMAEDKMELVPVARMIAEPMGDWETVIGRIVAERDMLAGGILRLRWFAGKLAMAVSEERGKPESERRFPGHTIHDIAVEIQEADSTVYNCMRFHARTTPQQLDHLISQGWAWRAVCALVTVEDNKVRRRLQNEYEQGNFPNSDAFKEAVRDVKEDANLTRSRKRKKKNKKAKASFGGRYIKSRIGGFNTVSGTLLTRAVPELLDGLQTYRSRGTDLAPATAENIAAMIAEARDNIDVLLKRLGDVRAKLDKIAVPGARAKAEGAA